MICITLLASCGTDETPVCSVSTVTIFDKGFTRFTFSRNSMGAATLDLIKVNDGTDSSNTYSYTYFSGALTNVTRIEDGTAISYSVTMEGNKVSKFSSKTSTNPLKGHYYLDNLDTSFMLNIPQKITYKDMNGVTVSSDTYTIEQDGSGLLSKATSGSSYVEATYTCQ